MNTLIIVLLVIAVCAGVYTLLDSRTTNVRNASTSKSEDSVSSQKISTSPNQPETALDNSGSIASDEQTKEISRTEEVTVENNSAEYDLKVSLYEDSNKATFLELEYYYEGEGRLITFDSMEIPEILDIFAKRDKDGSNTESYRIKEVYLNPKLAKAYLVISGASSFETTETTLYAANLSDEAVTRIFSKKGKYTKLYFNKGLNYLAYSYNDPLYSSAYQESSLFEAVDCTSDILMVENSRIHGKRIGLNLEPQTVYDYIFVSWYGDNIVKLRQKAISKGKDEQKNEKEVLYDISRNLFVNPDGTALKADSQAEGNGKEAKPATESEALKTLEAFYSYLANEKDYPEAMKLLDDKFTLKMLIIKSFGVDELVKSDIDVESAAGFSDLLKSSSIEAVVGETEKDGTAVISFYQLMNSGTDSQVKLAMSAKLSKSGKEWKIVSLQEADSGKPPFAK